MTAHEGSLLQETDLDRKQFLNLIELAGDLKRERARGNEKPWLTGRHIALVFAKNSTRTRCAFEVAAGDQGARVTFIGPEGSHMGREESIRDTARVLSRMYDGIAFRGFEQRTVTELADYADVPVWNALTNEWHPTQMLADVLTMTEHFDDQLPAAACCFIGDGRNNVARSLLVTGGLLGFDVRIAAPAGLQPPADVRTLADELARSSGARLLITADVERAVAGADFVYTDVWLSMGEPAAEWAHRIDHLRPYRVTPEVMAASGKASTRFMHCLPSLHDRRSTVGEQLYREHGLDGLEVTDAVFESPASIVFDQAENRMHTIKALLVEALAG